MSKFSFANEIKELKGYWFECEFSGKIKPPNDNCKMLDDDGFLFDNEHAIHTLKTLVVMKKNVKNKKLVSVF